MDIPTQSFSKQPVLSRVRPRVDYEVSEHILHKLNYAGASRNIISEAALGAIHGYSRGNPRLIDNLMTDALTIGAQQERQVIDDEIILAAVNNQNL